MKKLSDYMHEENRQRMRFVYGALVFSLLILVGWVSYSLGNWNGSRSASNSLNAHYSKKMKKLFNEYKDELKKADKRTLNAQVSAVIMRDINQDGKKDAILLRNTGRKELFTCAKKGGRGVCHIPLEGGKEFQKLLDRMTNPL
jgi:ribosomal protein L28